TTPPILGTRPWLQSRLTNLSPYQRSEVESQFEAWLHDPDRQILVVNILCDWFEQERQPRKEDLLKFYQAKPGVTEDGGKGGQGARGAVIGYTCEWPGCGKELSGRTDRVQEDALNHLNIKIFACDAKDCNASFLRKKELNRHVKSCKLLASNQPARRKTRTPSFSGTPVDISPYTSGRDSPPVPRLTDSSSQPFLPRGLPKGHLQSMNQQTPKISLFENMADDQMTFHGHSEQQQQSPPWAPPTLLQGQDEAQAHASSTLVIPPRPCSPLSSASDTESYTDSSMPPSGGLPVPPNSAQAPPPSKGSPAGQRQSASPTPGISGEAFGDIEHSPSLPPKINTLAPLPSYPRSDQPDHWRHLLLSLASSYDMKVKCKVKYIMEQGVWRASYYILDPGNPNDDYLGADSGVNKDVAKECAAQRSYATLTTLIQLWTGSGSQTEAEDHRFHPPAMKTQDSPLNDY
ncbi:hypothetical protein M408DRAFT_22281, partial [Serendipita vermifera MAFF 305830]